MEKLLLLLLVTFLQSPAWACKLKPLNECATRDKIRLESSTFSHLEKDVWHYQNLLDKHIEKALQKRPKSKSPGMSSCFNYHFSSFYFQAIREFAKKHRGQFCTQHLPLLYSSINALVDQKSTERRLVQAEQAKMDLLEQAMEVSEALLYFKNKHTK